MAIWGKKPEEGNSDFLAPRPAEGQTEKSHSLAEIAVDAGSIDVTPSTASIQVVAEDQRLLSTWLPNRRGQPRGDRSN